MLQKALEIVKEEVNGSKNFARGSIPTGRYFTKIWEGGILFQIWEN